MNAKTQIIGLGTLMWTIHLLTLPFPIEANSTLYTTPEPSAQPCESRKELTARSYWYYELYFGLADLEESKDRRTGRVNSPAETCFWVLLEDLKDAKVRTHGYKDGLHEILRTRNISITFGNDDPTARFQRAQDLVGQKFGSLKKMQKWWYENRDYLFWSPDNHLMIIDDNAKSNQTPVSKEYRTIRGHEYWHSFLLNRLKNLKQDGSILKADMWTYHGYQGVKLTVQEKEDPGGKGLGYTRALGEIIRNYQSTSEITTTNHEYYVEKLQALTGKPYVQADQWVRWWKKYGGRLQYSPQEDRLIPID